MSMYIHHSYDREALDTIIYHASSSLKISDTSLQKLEDKYYTFDSQQSYQMYFKINRKFKGMLKDSHDLPH